MKNSSKKMIFAGALYLMVFLWMVPTAAHAYLDPGTGSLIIQAAIALIAGSLLFAKSFWSKITSFFGNDFSKNKDPEHTSQEEDEKNQ